MKINRRGFIATAAVAAAAFYSSRNLVRSTNRETTPRELLKNDDLILVKQALGKKSWKVIREEDKYFLWYPDGKWPNYLRYLIKRFKDDQFVLQVDRFDVRKEDSLYTPITTIVFKNKKSSGPEIINKNSRADPMEEKLVQHLLERALKELENFRRDKSKSLAR